MQDDARARPAELHATPTGGHGEAALGSTMRWVALAGTAALLGTMAAVGCGPQQQCPEDSDWTAASQCQPEQHVCVPRNEDITCSPACAEWQFCSEGNCSDRSKAIVVLEPAAGTVD